MSEYIIYFKLKKFKNKNGENVSMIIKNSLAETLCHKYQGYEYKYNKKKLIE